MESTKPTAGLGPGLGELLAHSHEYLAEVVLASPTAVSVGLAFPTAHAPKLIAPPGSLNELALARCDELITEPRGAVELGANAFRHDADLAVFPVRQERGLSPKLLRLGRQKARAPELAAVRARPARAARRSAICAARAPGYGCGSVRGRAARSGRRRRVLSTRPLPSRSRAAPRSRRPRFSRRPASSTPAVLSLGRGRPSSFGGFSPARPRLPHFGDWQ